MMIKDFVINTGMLVAFLSICYQIFRNTGISPALPLRHRVLAGGIFGLLGVTLMIFSVRLPNNVMIDFRNLAVMLSAFSGGWVSGAISGAMLPVFRILIFGVNRSSIAAAIVMLILTTFFCIITQLKIKKQFKWIIAVVISEVVSCIAFSILIDNPELKKQVNIYYCIGLTLVSFLLYYYVRYIEELTKSFRHYKQQASRDFLTGLNNVRQFDTLYNNVINEVKLSGDCLSLLYIDIDFFKKVNDTYGHKEGDNVLKRLGEILINSCRSIDVVSRNGGEEFSVILANCPPNIAIEIAENIRKSVEETEIKLSSGIRINITVSIGISSYPDPIADLDKLREKADEGLYEAKRTGRNKVVLAQ